MENLHNIQQQQHVGLSISTFLESSHVITDGDMIIGLYDPTGNPIPKRAKRRNSLKTTKPSEWHKSPLAPNTTDTKTTPYTCPVCLKTFVSKSNLQIHATSIHNSARSFSCDTCNKVFTQKCNLKRHELTHSGKKSFSCVQCGRRFTQKVNLRRHFITHSGKKMFACDLCGKTFIQKSNLKKHQETHKDRSFF